MTKPWGEEEINEWRAQQQMQRSYEEDVILPLSTLNEKFNISAKGMRLETYGVLAYDGKEYPLSAVQVSEWSPSKPSIIITGGVHGYETSGVKGALRFLETSALRYAEQFNIVVAPCVSPWSYETINRWNPKAQDPNRGFKQGGNVQESALLFNYIQKRFSQGFHTHIDLHEATDSDTSIFQPITAQRDGVEFDGGTAIPDGFFAISDVGKQNPALEHAIIERVKTVTHIAPPDLDGTIYGVIPQQEGVIYTNVQGITPLMTNPVNAITTEMYPDSLRIKDKVEEPIQAQIAAIEGALDFLGSGLG